MKKIKIKTFIVSNLTIVNYHVLNSPNFIRSKKEKRKNKSETEK